MTHIQKAPETMNSKERVLKTFNFEKTDRIPIDYSSNPTIHMAFCRELGITTPNCGACLSNMAVTPGGNVVPCQSWLSDKPLGSMLGDEWEMIWNGERCQKRRDYAAQMLCECPLRILRGPDGVR